MNRRMDPHTMRWRSHGAPPAQAVPASQCLGDVSHTSAGGPSASSGPENDSVLYAPFWLSAAKLPNKEASVRADPSHRLTEYTSSFSLLNQCILHHLAMRRTRVSAGDGGGASTHSAISFLTWLYSLLLFPLGQINMSQIVKMICQQPSCHWLFSSQDVNRRFWAIRQILKKRGKCAQVFSLQLSILVAEQSRVFSQSVQLDFKKPQPTRVHCSDENVVSLDKQIPSV